MTQESKKWQGPNDRQGGGAHGTGGNVLPSLPPQKHEAWVSGVVLKPSRMGRLPAMVSRAREAAAVLPPHVEFHALCVDEEALPFAEGQFDLPWGAVGCVLFVWMEVRTCVGAFLHQDSETTSFRAGTNWHALTCSDIEIAGLCTPAKKQKQLRNGKKNPQRMDQCWFCSLPFNFVKKYLW